MFGFLKSKQLQAEPVPEIAPQPGPADTDALFMGACVAHAFQGFGKNGVFQGVYAGLPDFECKTMPEGIEVAGSAEKMACAILAENVMTVMIAGATPLHWSHLAVGVYCKHTIGMEPEWDILEDGVLTATLAVGPELEFHFKAAHCDTIDPVWSGERMTGASLMIEVRKRAPMGGVQ